MYNILIKNAKVVDGTGNPWFHADIGIEKGKITKMGKLDAARADLTIDANKRIVSPGFIDIHSHSDWNLLKHPTADSKIMQGVTLEVNGNCGGIPAPLREQMTREEISSDWLSFNEYFEKLEKHGISLNVVQLAGFTTLRDYVTEGEVNRLLTDNELRLLKKRLSESIEDGCFGLSSGLEFGYMRTLENKQEIIEACKVVSEHDCFYATHQRERDIWYEQATEEAIETAIKSGLNQVHLSHFVVRYPAEGKSPVLMWMVDEARKRGVNVTCDVITPNYRDGYHWAGERLENKLVPDWVLKSPVQEALKTMNDPEMQEKFRKEHEPDWKLFGIPANGRFKKEYPEGLEAQWDRIKINVTKASPELIGKTISEIALEKKKDAWHAALDIVTKEGRETGKFHIGILGSSTADWDSTFVMKHSTACICSDRGINAREANAYGAFPRIFRIYVRYRHILTFEEAVMKMTHLPAKIIKLRDRGAIQEGMWADLVVFDPNNIADMATIENPEQYPVGIDYVIVNGEVAVEKGKHKGTYPGKVLRKELK